MSSDIIICPGCSNLGMDRRTQVCAICGYDHYRNGNSILLSDNNGQ